ncbi:MAG: ABC transporter permease [Oscillospiraceae bacterium]|nr:ABC transporter permease [Oscillospiraceae bacterium]
MKTFNVLLKRNIKMFFNDKAMFFTSLITPVILLVLYATFLGNVYRDSFLSSLPEGFSLDGKIIDGFVGGQLVSSLLAVCCVTVSFCSNMLMVQDKVSRARTDFEITPVKKSVLSLSYFTATFISTLIISIAASAVCLLYILKCGWYLSFSDILLMTLDIVLLVLFGTAISSLINSFLKTQGQISAVGTIVSSGYGFISGAYMPISQFSEGLRNVISLLPGTYGTSLLRNHALGGVLREMKASGVPEEMLSGIRDSVDCNLYFFKNEVSIPAMYAVLGVSTVILIAAFVAITYKSAKKAK